ncbi:unnamed protein product [Candidula unifasciata]|uniref:Uncharacterized protein n=1 Tax=Candidula unifasciata TaxID=100452 RepID=A0A8S3YI47_9EUPU|nr:unnamed protein product [Candidula unifasciata]
MVDLDYSRLPLVFCGTTSGDIVVVHGRTGVFQFTVPGKPLPLGVTALSYVRMWKEEVFCVLVGTGEGKVGYYTITRDVGSDRKVTGIMKLREGKKQWQDERESTSITSISKIGEGNSFFVGTKDCKIYRFNMEKWKAELMRTCSRTAIRAMAFPRGTDELLVTGEHAMVRVHNLKQLLEVRRYIRVNRTCKALAVNHDGTQIFSGWDDGTTIVLGFAPKDLSLSELYRIQCTHKQAVTSIDLTSKSDVLVSGGDDGQCRVWRLVDDLDTRGKRLRQGLLLYHLTSQTGPITKVQVSENDEMCVSSSVDGSAVLYELSRGLKKGGVKVDLGLTSVSFCSNDLHLITCGGDGKIYFWEIKSGECLRIVDGCSYGGVFCLDVEKKDKKLFACSGEDRLVKLWCLDEARVSHIGQAHSDIVLKVKFGPCGTVLVSGAKDGSICVWDVPKVECG